MAETETVKITDEQIREYFAGNQWQEETEKLKAAENVINNANRFYGKGAEYVRKQKPSTAYLAISFLWFMYLFYCVLKCVENAPVYTSLALQGRLPRTFLWMLQLGIAGLAFKAYGLPSFQPLWMAGDFLFFCIIGYTIGWVEPVQSVSGLKVEHGYIKAAIGACVAVALLTGLRYLKTRVIQKRCEALATKRDDMVRELNEMKTNSSIAGLLPRGGYRSVVLPELKKLYDIGQLTTEKDFQLFSELWEEEAGRRGMWANTQRRGAAGNSGRRRPGFLETLTDSLGVDLPEKKGSSWWDSLGSSSGGQDTGSRSYFDMDYTDYTDYSSSSSDYDSSGDSYLPKDSFYGETYYHDAEYGTSYGTVDSYYGTMNSGYTDSYSSYSDSYSSYSDSYSSYSDSYSYYS